MKANDVLEKLGITRQTLTKWVREKKIAVIELVNGQYEYNDQDVYNILMDKFDKNTNSNRKNLTMSQYLSKNKQNRPVNILDEMTDNLWNEWESKRHICKKIVVDIGSGDFKLSERAVEIIAAIKNCDKEKLEVDRDDKDLIYVVEKLGSDANGNTSILSIKEINPFLKYTIKRKKDGKEYIDILTNNPEKTIDDYLEYFDKYQYLEDENDDGFENEFFQDHKSMFLGELESNIKELEFDIQNEKSKRNHKKLMEIIETNKQAKKLYDDFITSLIASFSDKG